MCKCVRTVCVQVCEDGMCASGVRMALLTYVQISIVPFPFNVRFILVPCPTF